MSDTAHTAPRPSEFDLQPDERKLSCGCYVGQRGRGWWITGQKFECVHDHRLGQEADPDA